ncbi:MAG: exopolyphosphatase, partial [Acidimicrobiales bacterium]
PADLVPQHVVVLGGDRTVVESVAPEAVVEVTPADGPSAPVPAGPTVAVPLGRIAGARSGDKGGDANLGVFARSDAAWAWLDDHLTTDRLRELLPETAGLQIERHRLPAIRSLNFMLRGLLGEGVAASTRQDGQAKSLGEWLRARIVDVPESLLEDGAPVAGT